MAEKKKSNGARAAVTVLGAILCVVFGFMLICNVVIIVKGTVNPDVPPSLFGTTPMVVRSGSMSGNAEDHIEVGDLIFVGKADINALKEGDIITFTEESSKTVVTHRIIEVTADENGEKTFITKGDANNIKDMTPVTADRVIGIFKTRIPKVGDFAMFLQTPLGMVVFIGVPILAFIIYDIIRRQRYADKDRKKSEEMEAELEKLRALANEKEKEEK